MLNKFWENCSYLTLKRFLLKSFGEMCLLGEIYIERCKKIQFLIFESTLNLESVSMPLRTQNIQGIHRISLTPFMDAPVWIVNSLTLEKHGGNLAPFWRSMQRMRKKISKKNVTSAGQKEFFTTSHKSAITEHVNKKKTCHQMGGSWGHWQRDRHV